MLLHTIVDFIIACVLFNFQVSTSNIPTLFSSNATLTIPQGTLFGRVSKTYSNETYYSFQGIPYAEPPIGDLRFKSPKPAKPWKGVLNATQICVICPQFQPISSIFGNVKQSEDCLNLHIYTKMPTEPQPVMVYIHGGAYVHISKEIFYRPDYFIHENVILITIQYRLNIFGFLSIDDAKFNIPGNAGLKDQVEALKWIQKNVKYFGGDPKSVTIFGESAGGSSVHLLTLSPMTQGLFHRAISQSGGPTNPWLTNDNKYRQLASTLKCDSNNLTEIVNCFYNSSTSEIIGALGTLSSQVYKIGDLAGFNSFIIEKHNKIDPFLTKDPDEIVKNKEYYPVPFITGICKDEGALFVEYYKNRNGNKLNNEHLIPKRLNITIGTKISKNLGQNISNSYYGNKTAAFDLHDPTIEVLTDLMFINSIYYFAIIQNEVFPNSPIWFYEFHYPTTYNVFKNRTTHADDIPYLFRPNDRLIFYDINDHTDEYIGRYRLVKLWTTFAKYGDPNPYERKYFENGKWKPLSHKQFNYLYIHPEIEMKTDLNYRHTKFWKNIYDEYGSNIDLST